MGGGEVKACEQGQAMRNVGSNRAAESRDTGLRRPMLRGRAMATCEDAVLERSDPGS